VSDLWCVKTRMGKLVYNTISTDIRLSINRAFKMFDIDYEEYRLDGYEEVLVNVSELKESDYPKEKPSE